MGKIYISHNNIISSLGMDSKTVVSKIKDGISGLKVVKDDALLNEAFCSSLLNKATLASAFKKMGNPEKHTTLEQMMLLSLSKVIDKIDFPLDEKVGLIISTTKGNIDTLEKDNPFTEDRAYLATLGKVIKDFFSFKNDALVLSNACISGSLALGIAKRYIAHGTYNHVFVVGGDVVSKFILSGFQSFQALSNTPCEPYSKDRKGINIGELAGTALVTNNPSYLCPEAVCILGESSCNDANHISGPSRTGEGLYQSVYKAMEEAQCTTEDIQYISAHGTATAFNDEMEAIAFNRLGLQHTPLNSLKGYFGHTLGASGLVETIIGMHSVYQNTLFPSLGFKELGVSMPINIIQEKTTTPLQTFLKTASGFGGCNSAMVLKKCSNE